MAVDIRTIVPIHKVAMYDGTNAAELLAAMPPAITDGWTLISEEDGVATFRHASEGDRIVTTGQWMSFSAIAGFTAYEYPHIENFWIDVQTIADSE
jgi:hypothetical protein